MLSKNNNLKQTIFLYISVFEGIIAFILTLNIPSDPKNSVLFGLSYARLAILAGILFILVILVLHLLNIKKVKFILSLTTQFLSARILSNELIRVSLFILLYTIIFIPSYQFGRFVAVYERIQPFLVYISLVFLQALICIQINKVNFFSTTKKWQFRKIIPEILVVSITFLTAIFSIMTGIGITIDHFFWGGASTPLLISTVLIAFWGTAVLFFIKNKFVFFGRRFDLLIPLILFFSAILIWNAVPFTPSFFAPAPVPPNHEFYPYSDAHYYDTTAQSLMVGEGYLNRGWVQKPFYGYLLFLFHLISGEDYLSTVFLQTCLYAIVPVLFYLIGKSLYSRYLGLFFALIGVIREVTAMRTTPWIEVTHSKIMMAEPLAVLISTLICYLVIKWYFAPKKNRLQLIVLGFLLMVGMMTRGNMLFYFIPIIFVLLVDKEFSLKTRLFHVGILVLSAFVIALPWMIRNQVYTGYFSIEAYKFQGVIDSRYDIDEPVEQYPTPEKPDDDVSNSALFPSGYEISKTFSPLNYPISFLSVSILEVTTMPTGASSIQIIQSAIRGIGTKVGSILEIVKFTSAHFIHNEILSVFMLPNTLKLETVKEVIDQNAYFSELWQGQVSFQLWIATILNVIILAIGIGSLFRKIGWISIFPLSMHLFYNLTNGLARVSGWRYVFVTDWVIILYYLIGILSLFVFFFSRLKLNSEQFGFSPDNRLPNKSNQNLNNWFSIVLLFSLLIGMIIPEQFIKSKYLGNITAEKFLMNTNIEDKIYNADLERLSTILSEPQMVIVNSKALYPRFYIAGTGEPGSGTPWFNYATIDRFGFTIVGPVRTGVIMPRNSAPEEFPNAVEVYVIGTWNHSVPDYPYLDGQFVYLPDEDIYYFSSQE